MPSRVSLASGAGARQKVRYVSTKGSQILLLRRLVTDSLRSKAMRSKSRSPLAIYARRLQDYPLNLRNSNTHRASTSSTSANGTCPGLSLSCATGCPMGSFLSTRLTSPLSTSAGTRRSNEAGTGRWRMSVPIAVSRQADAPSPGSVDQAPGGSKF
jgi:hypothetical protein